MNRFLRYGVVGGFVMGAGAPCLGIAITSLGAYLAYRDYKDTQALHDFVKNNPSMFSHLWK